MKGILQFVLQRSNGVNSNKRLLSPFLTQCYYYSLNPFFSTTTQKKNPCPQISNDMADFLATSCGLSAKKAAEIVNRRTSAGLRTSHGIDKAKTAIGFLRETGFDDTHIRRIVIRNPSFLIRDLKKTLIPKIRGLQDIGLSGSSIGELMSNSVALSRQNLVPALDFLREVLNNDEEVIKCLKNFGFFKFRDLDKTVGGNIEVLRDSGVVIRDNLGSLMYNFPMIFKAKPGYLAQGIARTKELGFDIQEKIFMEALGVICKMKETTWVKKVEMWKSYGWKEEDIVTGFRKCPRFMLVSESKIPKVVKFFMVELKHSPSELATRSRILAGSMEKKTLPRYAVFKKVQSSEDVMLKVKKKSLFSLLAMSEMDFRQNVLTCLKDGFPDDYEAYLKAVDGAKE